MTARLPPATLLPQLFGDDAHNGWSRGMRRVTHALLAGVTVPPGPILEVGCGGGQMLAELRAAYPYRSVTGLDLTALALRQARRRMADAPLLQATVTALPVATQRVALLLALDVFDQQGVELAAALAEARRVLVAGGVLLLRVSAYPWLYGPHDVAFHTGQRYTRRELAAALTAADLVPLRITHANACLAAPVIAQRLGQRLGLLPWMPGLYGQRRLHDLAARWLQHEAGWLRRRDLPIGLSLVALARKPVTTHQQGTP